MSKNKNLHKAKKEKNDEFYTLLSDIEKEMVWYKDFFKYFSENFELLGLKKLITTGYIPGGHGVVLEYCGDKNGDFMVSDDEISTRDLAGDGDFRSPECIEFLKQADVVVTNPPFSLFREYIAQLFQYNKKFIIIGNMNAITYKEVYPKIQNNELWAGNKCFGGGMNMIQPKDTFDASKTKSYTTDDKGNIIKNIMGVIWFTNIEHVKRHTPLELYKKYTPEDYPKYDNYDAINVNKVEEIPQDYFGVIGVPITFLDKYCPEQFEIIQFRKGDDGKDLVYGGGSIYLTSAYSSEENEVWKEAKIKQYGENWVEEVYKNSTSTTLLPGMIKNAEGMIDGKITYARILIKRKS